MSRHRDCDVIIIGGGLFGCVTGFFLAQQGLSAVVLERGHIGAQSSGANFGSLRLQGRIAGQYPLSLRAQHLWERFDELFGEPCDYERTGHIYFARDDASRAALLGYAQASRDNGLAIEILEGATLRERLPFLAPEADLASHSERCATANPRLATPAVGRAFVRAGGQIRTQWEVVSIRQVAGRFEVATADGATLSAPRLVNAAGAWAGGIATQFGEPVPLFGAGPPQFVTEPLPYVLRPVLQSIEGDVILRQTRRGNFIFAGYPRTRANADGKHTFVPPQKVVSGMAAIVRAMPGLAGMEVMRNWSGVEGYLPDMLPVISASETTENLFHVFGACGGGFQIGPAVGESLAELISQRSPTCDLSLYGIGRFKGGLQESDKIAREFDA